MLCQWGREIKTKLYEMSLYGKVTTVKLKADVLSVSSSSELSPFLSFTSSITFHNEKAVIFFNHSLGNIT